MYSLSTALHHSASTAVVARACPAPAAVEEVEVRKCHLPTSSAETGGGDHTLSGKFHNFFFETLPYSVKYSTLCSERGVDIV